MITLWYAGCAQLGYWVGEYYSHEYIGIICGILFALILHLAPNSVSDSISSSSDFFDIGD